MFKKVFGRQPGEIAIRTFRAAYELGIGTAAVYPVEDRNSVHRNKADESYQIEEPGHPVRAYLSVENSRATLPGTAPSLRTLALREEEPDHLGGRVGPCGSV